jgi:prepilin-type N-terminal cleavage/methylation domain-containing protein
MAATWTHTCPRRGFTIVELLVVITIIVVLLALLTPALDRAMYQAELAACAASLDTGASAFLTYAAGNRRAYPHRNNAAGTNVSGNHPRVFGAGIDLRPLLRDYASINGMFNDPLAETVDYSDPVAGAHGYAARSVWPSYRFDGEPMMRKLGDRWGWTDRWGAAAPRPYRFDVIIGDLDFLTDNLTQTWGSHPDADGLMAPERWQNEVVPVHALLPRGAGVNRFIMSRWWVGLTSTTRGAVDLNFAHDDGAVTRFTEVTYFDTLRGSETTRLRGVGWNSTDQWSEAIRCSVPAVN